MSKRRKGDGYPPYWKQVAKWIKDEAGWRCVRCGHDHELSRGYCLTVHHINGVKMDMVWFNLAALCQRCHLSIQGRVKIDRPWVMTEHSEWFRPYVAGHYARRYLDQILTRDEVMARLDELLQLESEAVLGKVSA